MRFLCLLPIVAVAAFGQAFDAAASAADVAILVKGVTTLPVHGVPGPVLPLSSTAFPVVTGGKPKERAALVAAARVGEGRVVVFGHGGYLSAADASRTMVVNAMKWVVAGRKGPVAVDGSADLVQRLVAEGIDARRVKASVMLADPKAWSALLVDTHAMRDEHLDPLREHLRQGGGLVTAGLVWGWMQIRREDDPAKHPGNKLLAPMGLAFGDGYLGPRRGSEFVVDGKPDPLTHPLAALAKLSRPVDAAADRKAEQDRMAAAAHTLVTAVRTVAPDDRLLRPALEAERKRMPPAVPTDAKPLGSKDALARVLLAMELDALALMPPEKMKAHPAAADFPGAVPESAPRVERAVTVDLAVDGWHSTGLYAPPGGTVTVEVPPGTPIGELGWRIGCHSDGIWGHDAWKRAPKVDASGRLGIGATPIASPFGGLVYITSGRRGKGSATITIRGAVRAPLFVAGRTDLAAWEAEERSAPGPWAEIATKKVVITVPSSVVRDLKDPDRVAAFWDAGLDACADLAAISRERPRPERMVADVQISAGYMHSGYPIMTHLDVARRFVTPKEMLDDPSSGWGFFHELGHNHQEGAWTFEGTGEVTNNLFTLYCLETVCGLKDGGHDAMDETKSRERMAAHLAKGAPYEAWKSDPFLALSMYVQLRRAFGWEPFKKVFASYRDPSAGPAPRNDDEKRDQWMVRFSKVVERDLGPFFRRWGVPVSADAEKLIGHLPPWMPESSASRPGGS